jgi:hypothetical protein
MATQAKIILEVTSTDGLIDSAFIVKLRQKFNNPGLPRGQSLWDDKFAPAGPGKKLLIAEDIARAFTALFMRVEKEVGPVAAATKNSAEKVVADFLLAQPPAKRWPNDPSFPTLPPWEKKAFRRYEVAAAMYVIMSAFNESGAGGGPASLPPSLPS